MENKVIKRISNLILSFVAILGLLLGLKEITNFNVQDILIITVVFFFIFLVSLIISPLKRLENEIIKTKEKLKKFQDNLEIWKEINRIKNLIENAKKK